MLVSNVLIKKLQNTKISNKFFIYFSIFVIIPLLVAIAIINLVAGQIITQKSIDSLLSNLKNTQKPLTSILKETEYLSINVLGHDKVQDMVKYYIEKSYLNVEKSKIDVKLSIQDLLYTKEYINSLCISRDGNIIFQFGDGVLIEEIKYNEKAHSLDGKAFWTPVYKLENRASLKDEVFVVSLIRLLRDLDSPNYLGVERISIDERFLCQTYNSINVNDYSISMIMNETGSVISSTDKQYLGYDITDNGFYNQIANQSEGFVKGTFLDEQYYVFYYTIDDLNWKVLQFVPINKIFEQKTIINQFIIFILFTCLVFMFVFSFFLDKTIIKPIKLLSSTMNDVGLGNFNVSLAVNSNDEIGNLHKKFVQMVQDLKNMIDRVYIAELSETKSKIMALEAQINPHFLYNALDTIRWIAINNKDYETGEQIESLANLFRYTLENQDGITSVYREVEHLQNYINIQKHRFGNRISVDICINDDIMDCKTPKLILQPLVENAYNHGFETSTKNGKIEVRGTKIEDSKIKYIVKDNGVGANEEKIHDQINGNTFGNKVHALKNIHDRITLKYGNTYGLVFSSEENKGTIVEVILPYIHNEAD